MIEDGIMGNERMGKVKSVEEPPATKRCEISSHARVLGTTARDASDITLNSLRTTVIIKMAGMRRPIQNLEQPSVRSLGDASQW